MFSEFGGTVDFYKGNHRRLAPYASMTKHEFTFELSDHLPLWVQLKVDIEDESLDDRGMVLDFADIKQSVSTWIDENLDHRMILNHQDPAVPLLEDLGEPMYLIQENPTAENIARLQHYTGLDAPTAII